jgi:GST-like protein
MIVSLPINIMIKLYAFATPNNLKPMIMLEELGLEYELHAINIRLGEQKTDEFQKLNPNAKVPVLIDGDMVLTESAAMLVYLAEKHHQLLPSQNPQRAKVFEQLFFHASGVSPAFGNSGFFQKMASEQVPFAIERFKKESERLCQILDDILTAHTFVTGDEYSIADIAHFGWMWRADFVGLDLSKFTHLSRWYHEIHARPGVQAAIAKISTLVKS